MMMPSAAHFGLTCSRFRKKEGTICRGLFISDISCRAPCGFTAAGSYQLTFSQSAHPGHADCTLSLYFESSFVTEENQ